MTDIFAEQLRALESRGRRRVLAPGAGIDFSSNDYIGLAGDDRLREIVAAALARGVPVGSGGSRLLRGNGPEHLALEEEAARFFGAPAALYLSSGYAANALLLSTLPQRGDLIVHDALIHASAHEGMRLARAESVGFAHDDPGAAADAIAAWRAQGGTGTPWIAVESLYSMDGDIAPLAEFAQLARAHDAMLLIDEAHATGVYGPDGRGLAAQWDGQENVITLKTCGKALGCEGALVLCPAVVRDFLVNRGRAFIFSTAPSPLMAAAVRGALGLLAAEPERRARLRALIDHARGRLAQLGLPATHSPIQPVIVGEDTRAVAAARTLQDHGFDVRAIRPPTVPEGTARLRLSLTLNVTGAQVDALMDRLGEIV